MKTELTHPCARCKGSGRVALADTDARTIAAIDVEWRSSTDIYARVKRKEPKLIKRNTLSMRLARLVEMGLVERRPSQEHVKEYDYRRIAEVHA